MTAKEYLSQVYALDRHIDALHERVAMLKERATRATSMMNAFRTSGTDVHSKLEDSVCKYVDLQVEIAEQIKRFYDLQNEVSDVINALPDEDTRILLTYRYLSFLPWESVAVKMGYSGRHVTRLHAKALDCVNMSLNVLSNV